MFNRKDVTMAKKSIKKPELKVTAATGARKIFVTPGMMFRPE